MLDATESAYIYTLDRKKKIDCERCSTRNSLVIASTHIPQKVDPALIANSSRRVPASCFRVNLRNFLSLGCLSRLGDRSASPSRVSRIEEIIPTLETSDVLAHLEKLCPTLSNGTRVVLNFKLEEEIKMFCHKKKKKDKDVQTLAKCLFFFCFLIFCLLLFSTETQFAYTGKHDMIVCYCHV
ncbi:hypothetical protein YC2023_035478 [Brassica napus]